MAGWGKTEDFTDEPQASKLSTFISKIQFHQIGYHGDSYHEDELILEKKWYDYRDWIAELTQNASSPSNLKELNVELSLDCYKWTKHWVYENEAERENYESHHLCLQSINPFWQGVCHGDSGSPLVMIDMVTNEVELVGIAEAAKYYCTLSPAYYTKVSKYLPWINENLKGFDPRHVMHLIKFDYFHLMINIVIIVIFFGFIFLSFITLYYYTTLPYNHWFRLLIILNFFKIFKIFKAGSARDFVMYLSMNFEELETLVKLEKEERKLSRREARRGLNYNEEAIKCTYHLHRRTIKYVNDILWPTHRRSLSCE